MQGDLESNRQFNSAASDANRTPNKARPISYAATFGSEAVGTMWYVFICGALTAWWRIMPGVNFDDFLLQGLVSGFLILGITAALFRISALFNFTSTLFGAFFMMAPKKYWPAAFVNSTWFQSYTMKTSRKDLSPSSFAILFKVLAEWSGQLGGSIAGAALVLLVLPSAVPMGVHSLGQPQVMGGITNTEALFTEVFLGALYKWAVLVAFGLVAYKRAVDDVNRSFLIAGAFAASRAIAAFTTQSSFNFWLYFGAGVIGAGFHGDWWIWFVGDLLSTGVALAVYYLINREVDDELEEKKTKK